MPFRLNVLQIISENCFFVIIFNPHCSYMSATPPDSQDSFFLKAAFWVHTNFLVLIGMCPTLSVSYIRNKSSSGSLHFLTEIFSPLFRRAVLMATICLFMTGRSDHHSALMPPLRNIYVINGVVEYAFFATCFLCIFSGSCALSDRRDSRPNIWSILLIYYTHPLLKSIISL